MGNMFLTYKLVRLVYSGDSQRSAMSTFVSYNTLSESHLEVVY